MKLTRAQKRWAIGGSIGAGVLFLGYELFRHMHSRSDHDPRQLRHGHHKEHGDEHAENSRGEYGRQKHHHHKRHHHG